MCILLRPWGKRVKPVLTLFPIWISGVILLQCDFESQRSLLFPPSAESNVALEFSAHPINRFSTEAKEIQGLF